MNWDQFKKQCDQHREKRCELLVPQISTLCRMEKCGPFVEHLEYLPQKNPKKTKHNEFYNKTYNNKGLIMNDFELSEKLAELMPDTTTEEQLKIIEYFINTWKRTKSDKAEVRDLLEFID